MKKITITETISPDSDSDEEVSVHIEGHGLYKCWRHALAFITTEQALERLGQVYEGEPGGGNAIIFWCNLSRASVVGDVAVRVAAIDTMGEYAGPCGQAEAVREWYKGQG